jgi:hypothetical protein
VFLVNNSFFQLAEVKYTRGKKDGLRVFLPKALTSSGPSVARVPNLQNPPIGGNEVSFLFVFAQQ